MINITDITLTRELKHILDAIWHCKGVNRIVENITLFLN
jgi:hypothetical protein